MNLIRCSRLTLDFQDFILFTGSLLPSSKCTFKTAILYALHLTGIFMPPYCLTVTLMTTHSTLYVIKEQANVCESERRLSRRKTLDNIVDNKFYKSTVPTCITREMTLSV